MKNKTTSIAITLITTLLLSISAIADDPVESTKSIYWVERVTDGDVRRFDLDTETIQTLQQEEGVLIGLAIDLENDYLYWSGSLGLRRSKLSDLGTIETLISEPVNDIALDLERSRIYFVPTNRQLRRMDLNDLSIETLGHADVYSLVVDPIDRKIYWSENRNSSSTPPVDDRISWSNMDEPFNPQTLYNVPGPFDNQVPASLAIDHSKRKLYVSVAGIDESVVRSNLAEDPDGLDYEIFVDEAGGYSLGLTIDSEERKIYWANLAGEILATDLDGDGSTTGDGANIEIILTGLERPEALELVASDTTTDICSVILPLTSGGILSLACRNIIFPETILEGQDLIVEAFDESWRTTDTTQTGAGWHVTLLAVDHLHGTTDPTHVIQVGVDEDFTVECIDSEIVPIGDSGIPPTCPIGPQPIPLIGQNPLTILSASQGQGMGIFDFVPHFAIRVPGTAIIDTYMTEVWVDIIAGP